MASDEYDREPPYAEPRTDWSGIITGVILAALVAGGVVAWMTYDELPNPRLAQRIEQLTTPPAPSVPPPN
jgi:hypothetical protein